MWPHSTYRSSIYELVLRTYAFVPSNKLQLCFFCLSSVVTHAAIATHYIHSNPFLIYHKDPISTLKYMNYTLYVHTHTSTSIYSKEKSKPN